jgi:hypothetical protein
VNDPSFSSLSNLVSEGDDLEMLKCLRLNIARQLEDTESGRDMAALSKQFMDVTKEIRALEKSKPKPDRRTALDDARNKRKKAPTKGKPGTSY